MALGADAVLIGRLYAYGLAVGGADGVEAVIRQLLAEVDLTLALCGGTAIAISTEASWRGSLGDVDLRDTPEEAAFRAELRAWLDANLPEEAARLRGGDSGSTTRSTATGAARSTTRAMRADVAEGVRRRRRALQLPAIYL